MTRPPDAPRHVVPSPGDADSLLRRLARDGWVAREGFALPDPGWDVTGSRLILHGRAVCIARRPRCEICVLNDFCPSSHTRPASSSRSATKQVSTAAVGGKSVGPT